MTLRPFSHALKTSSQQGFTLIEALVAMFIVAVGLLGVGFLIAFSIQRVQSSEQLGMASDLASQGLDIMRSNRLEAFRMTGPQRAAGTACAVVPALTNTPEQRRSLWDCRLSQALPNAQARWTYTNGIAAVEITWNRDRGEGEDSVVRFESRI